MGIEKIIFKAKRYLTVRKTIKPSDVTNKQMYDSAFRKLTNYLVQNKHKPIGSASVIYFKWDVPNENAELGISFPVEGIESVNDPELSIQDIPESKAIMTTLYGDYSGLAAVHKVLKDYLENNKLNYSDIAIEEMVSMPSPKAEDAITNVYYLYQ